MIGPTIEGFRVGQRVRVESPGSPRHDRTGIIVLIEQAHAKTYIFWIDTGNGQAQPFVSSKLRTVGHP